MQQKLLQFIDNSSLAQNDKDYLKMLIKEEQELLLEGMADYVRGQEKSLGELRITNYELQGKNIKDKLPVTSGVQPMGDAVSASVDTQVDHLDKALDYGDEVGEKAEETYDKVILSLKKNDKWLSKLIVKVGKSSEDIKDKFIDLLQNARGQLANIRKEMDVSWQEFDKRKNEADRTLGAQVASVRDQFRGQDHELEKNIIEFIEKLCSQYREKIDNMSKAFSGNLDSAAKKIDNLTNETSDKMRDIINEREQQKLMAKIMKT